MWSLLNVDSMIQFLGNRQMNDFFLERVSSSGESARSQHHFPRWSQGERVIVREGERDVG